MKGNTSLDLKILISFLPSADEHLPCPSIYLPPPLPTLKFLGREKDTPKMSSTQLSGGTFSSFFKSFFAPQRSPHTPNLPPPKPPLAIRVPARFQVESDWHLEHDLILSAYAIWEKSFPFSGDFLLLAGDCGRVNPNNLPNSTIAADHQTAYKGMLSRISKNYKHVFLISGNNEPKTLRGGPRIAETMLSLKSFESDIPNLTVLEKQSADISGLGYDSTILGCTLCRSVFRPIAI
jgi:hypothetical protein